MHPKRQGLSNKPSMSPVPCLCTQAQKAAYAQAAALMGPAGVLVRVHPRRVHTQARQAAPTQLAASVATCPTALVARLIPPLYPLGGAQRAVRARKRAALLLVAARLRHAAVVLLVAGVAVARLWQHAKGSVSSMLSHVHDVSSHARQGECIWPACWGSR